MIVKSNRDTEQYFFKEGCYITEWWNTEKDQQVSIAKVVLPAGQTTECHRLKNTSERYVILHGTGEVQTESGIKQLETGDIVYISAGERQSIHNPGDTDLVFLAICNPRFREENYQAC